MIEITLKGPGKNALGTAVMTSILEQLEGAAGKPVLLTGSGDALSAGLNLKEVKDLEGEGMMSFLVLLERVMTTLYLYPGPVVAAVNGHAIAGGCVLAQCCDHRVIANRPSIKMGLNEVALGLRFPPRTFAILRRRIPIRHHEEVFLGGALVNPETALRLGLVDEIAEDPVDVARTRLAAFSAHPANAFAMVKKDLRGTETELCPEDVEAKFLRDALPLWTAPELKQRIGNMLRA